MSIDMEIPPSDEQIEAAELQALSDEQQELEFINQNKNIMQTPKISKVKSVQPNGTLENQHGIDIGGGKIGFYKFEYLMEDGQVIIANHKTTEPFKEGAEVEYIITNEQYNSGKVSKPKDGNYSPQPNKPYVKPSGNGQQASFALSYAKDVYVTNGGTDPDNDPKHVAEYITALADELLTWLNEKSK